MRQKRSSCKRREYTPPSVRLDSAAEWANLGRTREDQMDRRVVLSVAGVCGMALLAATAFAGGKNLQHYSKDMSMSDLQGEMKVLRMSLGVGCDHCHQMKPKRDFTVDTAM